MENFKIALVQMNSSIYSKEDNLAKVNAFSKEAKLKGASMICFPEMCLCGYNREFPQSLAEEIPGHTTLKVSTISKDNNIVIIAGMLEIENNNMYITQIIAFPDGTVKKYRKTHLGKNEMKFCSLGQELPVFKLEYSKGKILNFGIGICYDLHFPEVVSIMSMQGAELIFSPFASPMNGEKRLSIWKKYMGARAYDNRVYVAACNFKGMAVWDPLGNLAKSYSEDDENMIMFNLDLDELRSIRQGKDGHMKNPFYLKHRRGELYRKYNY